jgi:hypothetical protein
MSCLERLHVVEFRGGDPGFDCFRLVHVLHLEVYICFTRTGTLSIDSFHCLVARDLDLIAFSPFRLYLFSFFFYYDFYYIC